VDDRERLRTTFDQAAELYQDARPEYPEELFNRLMDVVGLRPGDRVLEVGAGSGKATLPLARRGLRITAIEPGPALAAQARKNLAGYPVDMVSMRFEDWDGTPGELPRSSLRPPGTGLIPVCGTDAPQVHYALTDT
jgi:protein-L-isoaspartate O-methyltransferase